MKFAIKEGSSNDFYELYEKIREDVLNGMLVKDICAKYNISKGQWFKFRKELKKENISSLGRKKKGEGKYYYRYSPNKWVVKRHFEHGTIYYGSFPSERDCANVVAKLREHNWDKSKMGEIRNELGL